MTSRASKVHGASGSGRGKPSAIVHIGFFAFITAYLSNAVVSGKSPFYFSGSRSSEAAGITNNRLVACSARISVDTQTHRQTDKPTTVTLAVHACRGLNSRETSVTMNFA